MSVGQMIHLYTYYYTPQVRVADEDRGEVVQDSPLRLRRDRDRLLAGAVSSHLLQFCRDVPRDALLSSEHELYNILDSAASAADEGDDGDGGDGGEERVRVAQISTEAMKDSEHLPR